MILIADSGSTKTDWCVVLNGTVIKRLGTKGINPFFQSEEEIQQKLTASLLPQLPEGKFNAVYFYGAGCTPVSYTHLDVYKRQPESHASDSEKQITGPAIQLPDLTQEEEADRWIRTSPDAFCNTQDKKILSQVLNNYDQETTDSVSYTHLAKR